MKTILPNIALIQGSSSPFYRVSLCRSFLCVSTKIPDLQINDHKLQHRVPIDDNESNFETLSGAFFSLKKKLFESSFSFLTDPYFKKKRKEMKHILIKLGIIKIIIISVFVFRCLSSTMANGTYHL